MKYLFKFSYLLLLSITFIACNNNDSVDLNSELKTIDEILVEMKATAAAESKVIQFEVTAVDGLYDAVIINKFNSFEFDFNNGYINAKSDGGVTVECSDGTTTECSGENEGSCVGSAVRKCLDKGECANVCPAIITLAP